MTSLPDDPLPGSEWTDDIFEQPQDRPRQSRQEKREARHRYGLVRAKDKKQKAVPNFPPEVLRRDLQQMQENDNSLETVRNMVSDTSESTAPRVFWEGACSTDKGDHEGQTSWRTVEQHSLFCLRSVVEGYWSLRILCPWLGIWARRRQWPGYPNGSTGQPCIRTWQTSVAAVRLVRTSRDVKFPEHP